MSNSFVTTFTGAAVEKLTASSSQGTRPPWLGLQGTLVRLGGAVMDGRWAQQITGGEAEMEQYQHTQDEAGRGWPNVVTG